MTQPFPGVRNLLMQHQALEREPFCPANSRVTLPGLRRLTSQLTTATEARKVMGLMVSSGMPPTTK